MNLIEWGINVTDLQAIQMDILQEFMHVAETEQLQWFAMFGTLLGASRHGGFIPWDDDIDIALPRPDYDKLRSIAYMFREPYFLQTPENDPAAAPRYIKLRRTDTTLISRLPNGFTSGGHMGISIDIIPLDTVPDYESAKILQESAHRINQQMYASAALEEYEEYMEYEKFVSTMGERIPPAIEEACMVFGGIAGYYNFFAGRYHRYCSKYAKGRYYSMPVLCGERGQRVYDKKWFKKNSEMDFEGIKIRVPDGWKQVLVASFPDGLYKPKASALRKMQDKYIFADAKRPFTAYLNGEVVMTV